MITSPLAETSKDPRREDDQQLKLGLALSGGGFRATLFHLGVIKCLSDGGLLKNVSHVTAVSGGSILAAHLFENWNVYLKDFPKAAESLLAFVQYDIRGRILRRLPLRNPNEPGQGSIPRNRLRIASASWSQRSRPSSLFSLGA